MTVLKIVSGGQTGADRGALEAAEELGLFRGGWAPKGWSAEDGVIPERYRLGMTQSRGGYRHRTELNVRDSDGTLTFSRGKMSGGTLLTWNLARRAGRHVIWVDLSRWPIHRENDVLYVMQWLNNWVYPTTRTIEVLNVAGPRESKEPGVQHAVRQALVHILGGVD